MHIFFITTIVFLFGTSLYLASWTSSVVCSLLLLLIVWTRLFSNRIIKNSFKNLMPINKTDLHHQESSIQNAFTQTSHLPKPQIFIDPSAKNLQLYCFGDQKKPKIITSRTMLEEVFPRDLNHILNYTGVLHSEHIFSNKQSLVALFLYISSLGRYIDSTLSFILGIKTKKGEPKAITRRPLYFFLRKLHFIKKSKTSQDLLKNYSYLSFEHQNPILSPLSITDKTL